MPFVADVGDATTVLADVRVEWKIRNFFSLSDKVDDEYRSPDFNFDGLRWCMSLYPNGEERTSSTGWVSVFLVRRSTAPPKTVYCTFSIKGSGGVEGEEEFEYEFTAIEEGYGCPKFWSRSDLSDRKSILLPNNVLTITCDLRCNANGTKMLQKSLLRVLETGDDSDVVIKVKGKEFPAHRVILRARSPVFRSMFSHDMVEKRSNVVTIRDCDPETFPDFLVHIYSGSCEHISAKNVCSLYTAADKYDIGELKVACAEFMERNLTVDCFCTVITLAIRHDEKKLFKSAAKFFCDNSLDIVKRAEWLNFQKNNLRMGNELIIKALSK